MGGKKSILSLHLTDTFNKRDVFQFPLNLLVHHEARFRLLTLILQVITPIRFTV